MVPVPPEATWGPMNLARERPLIRRLLDEPDDPRSLVQVHQALGRDPGAYAALLIEAAGATGDDTAASYWLVEAARVKLNPLKEDAAAIRLLEQALERDPRNLRAAEHLVEIFRSRSEDRELAKKVHECADQLKARYSSEPVEIPRAVAAFEKLSSVYEAIGDAEAALATLRMAFEFERARNPNTTPSPPNSTRVPSLRTGVDASAEPSAPAPEPRWSSAPMSESRDTLPSPIPAVLAEPSSPESELPRRTSLAPGDPLLKVIEALHGLRRIEEVVEGAALVLRTVMDSIPSHAAFVHVCDEATRDYVVITALGDGSADVVGSRAPENDPLIAHALEASQSVKVDAGDPSLRTGTRWKTMCPARAVLCAPVHYDGRYFGAIELVDPLSSRGFRDADRHAMTYVGERLGEFLADRTIAF